MNIVFMGTPAFAVPALKALLDSKHSVTAVYTKAPKPAGRGYAETLSAVHKYALENKLKVEIPLNFKSEDVLGALRSYRPDAIVVAAYGLILPQTVLDIPAKGCINIHPSKLPRWRGASPLQHTILFGDKESQVCIMKMDIGMDTGEIIKSQDFEVPDTMTTYQLHDFTAELGAKLLIEALDEVEAGSATYTKQSEIGVTYANKITRENERLDFNQSAFMVNAQIRTFSPRPGAYFRFKDENIKVIEAEVINHHHDADSGTVLDDDLLIACSEGAIRPTLLQREGKKMIYRDAFLRGFTIPNGSIF